MTEISIRQIHDAAVRLLVGLIVVFAVVAAVHLGAVTLDQMADRAHVTPPGLALR